MMMTQLVSTHPAVVLPVMHGVCVLSTRSPSVDANLQRQAFVNFTFFSIPDEYLSAIAVSRRIRKCKPMVSLKFAVFQLQATIAVMKFRGSRNFMLLYQLGYCTACIRRETYCIVWNVDNVLLYFSF